MYIDIGCSNEKEAKEAGVRIGDPVVPDSSFSTIEKNAWRKPEGGGEEKPLGRKVIACGKACDDRVGAFIAAEVVRRLKEDRIDHPNTVVGAATVQEEVGLRGARTSAHVAHPDACLTLEVDIAGDVPGIEAHEAPTRMGLGPAILTYDASMVPNEGLKEMVIRTAEECRIPHQLSQMKGGGTDGGAIHMANAGCPSVVITVPTRHIHSHVALVSLEDIDNAVALVVEVVKRLDKKTVDSFTAI
jgi:endoglucanase